MELRICNANFNNNHSSFSYINVTDLAVNGLDDFDVKVLEFFKLTSKLTYDLTFNDIQILGQYFAKANITYPGVNLKAHGLGDVNLLLQQLRLNGSFRLLPHLKGLRMTHFKVNVSLGYVKSKFTGILDNKYATIFFNRWLEEFLTMGINDEYNQEIISELIRDIIVPKVNGFLSNYSLVDLFKLILGLGGGGSSNEGRMFWNGE